jgi:hypothetical protein
LRWADTACQPRQSRAACQGLWAASAKTTLDTGNGNLKVETPERGGVSKLEWAGDADYLAQADVNLNP